MQRVEARQQLAEGEGLGQVVIAAAAQAADAVIDLGQRAQDQNRRALAGLAQHLDDGQAVDVARQHAVHDDHIIGLAGGEKHAVPAVGRMIGGMAGFLQAFDDELADAFVVLDQQDLHVGSLERRRRGRRRGRRAVRAGASDAFIRARRTSCGVA